jgi:hypothetical protein
MLVDLYLPGHQGQITGTGIEDIPTVIVIIEEMTVGNQEAVVIVIVIGTEIWIEVEVETRIAEGRETITDGHRRQG